MNSFTDSTVAKWTVQQCPFSIEYGPRVVDDIRLAVVDAFFSLPRGGVEMGGILLGSQAKDRLTIVDSVPLECEHAFGPSFTLSPNDLAKLEKQLAELPRGGNARPVGWYHSHTRSGIFLSDADMEIHRRFFPESWQVALVLRPHSFEPVRAGFFFREADGSIRGTATYQEFLLDPLPVQPLPVQPRLGLEIPSTTVMPRRTPAPPVPVLEAQPVRETPPPPPPPVSELREPEAEQAPFRRDATPEDTKQALVEPPRFLAEPTSTSRRWVALVAILVGAGIGTAGYQTRDRWWPQAAGLVQKASASPATTAGGLGLATADSGGQLQIRWDRDAPVIRQGTGALLMIVDGDGTPLARGLDAALLKSGTFTYGRQSGRVDISLTVHQAGGPDVRESTAFMGAAPPAPVAGREDPAVQKKQDELAERAVRLQTDLNKQAARTRKLEKSLEDMRLEMQKKRMDAQIPDPEKK